MSEIEIISLQGMIDKLTTRRKRMVDYLLLKVDEADWHGVADAAMDIREIEAEINAYKGLLG